MCKCLTHVWVSVVIIVVVDMCGCRGYEWVSRVFTGVSHICGCIEYGCVSWVHAESLAGVKVGILGKYFGQVLLACVGVQCIGVFFVCGGLEYVYVT